MAAGLCWAIPAPSAAQSGLIVVPRPSTQAGLSYFKLGVQPGQAVRAGRVELRNLGARPLRVALAAVDGQTLSTLGSGYGTAGKKTSQRSTSWLRVGHSNVLIEPHRRVVVPVSVQVPLGAAPGDYLSGVSVEALGQDAQSSPRKGIAIASADRYAIGVEVSIPGPRHPLIRFTGAGLQRQPAGLSFLLLARNPGNVILQNTHGQALITDGHRTVANVPLGPGTFVSGTSIAYPIPTFGEHPREGTVYRVRAKLLYSGASTSLDTRVRFGHAAALTQQLYTPRKASSTGSSGTPAWLAALLGVAGASIVLGLGFVLLRRRGGTRAALPTLEAALEASRMSGKPLSLITLRPLVAAATAVELLQGALRERLRPGDRLCRLDGGGFLIVAEDSDSETAEALAADLRRRIERLDGDFGNLAIDVRCPDNQATAAALLAQIGATGGARVLVPSG